MDIEFDTASRRFARDQKSRQKSAAEKRRQLQAERESSRAQQQRWEQEQEAKRRLARAQEEEAAKQREHDLEHNLGVAFSRRLKPVLSLAGESKGIIRRADKVSLPPSASTELVQQQASKNGQLFFKLTTPSGHCTHAAILDFSAAEGTIGVPPELMRLLGQEENSLRTADEVGSQKATTAVAEIDVRYRRLPKGTFAKVQPLLSAFHEVGNVKIMLERELQFRTTLTVGDELAVNEGGNSYALRVLELMPHEAVSLIDTDLEVEVLPSVQNEAAIAAEQEAQRRREEEAAAIAEARQREAEAAAAEERAAIAATVARNKLREARRAAALEHLSEEPEAGTPGVVHVAVRCPDGFRCARRFLAEESLEKLFLLVEAYWHEDSESLLPQKFRLASSFPRRVFERPTTASSAVSLADVGLSNTQEALFVEIATGEMADDM